MSNPDYIFFAVMDSMVADPRKSDQFQVFPDPSNPLNGPVAICPYPTYTLFVPDEPDTHSQFKFKPLLQDLLELTADLSIEPHDGTYVGSPNKDAYKRYNEMAKKKIVAYVQDNEEGYDDIVTNQKVGMSAVGFDANVNRLHHEGILKGEQRMVGAWSLHMARKASSGSTYQAGGNQYVGNEAVNLGSGSISISRPSSPPKLSTRATELFYEIADKLMNGAEAFSISRGNNTTFIRFFGKGELQKSHIYETAFREITDTKYLIPPVDGQHWGGITGAGEELYEEMRRAKESLTHQDT